MQERDFLQLALFIVGLVAITPPFRKFMARVFAGEVHFLQRFLGPIERGVVLLVMDMTPQWLPFNPQHLRNVPFALTFNTAVSFMMNTNWQAYSGEATMSYFTQMAGLAVHNFVKRCDRHRGRAGA
jgi:K+-transporting ATPase ATPase A chain